MMANISQRLTQLLISGRWPLLGLAVLAGLLAVWPASRVEFDRSIENMFAADDPLLTPYRRLKAVFGGDEIVLLVYEDPQLLAPDKSGLERLRLVDQRCRDVPGVRAVLSLDRLRVGPVDAADADHPLAARMRSLFENYTHARDGRTAVVVCMLEPEEASRSAVIAELREIASSLPGDLPPGMLAGEPVLVADAFAYVQADGRRLGWWSAVLLGLTFLFCFRSLRWVIIPLAIVQLALILTRAVLALSALRLSMVSSMLTAIVTVVAVATVAHLIVRVRQGREQGLGPREALERAGAMLAAPIFFACLTDAMGFAALCAARVGPVRDFGLMMAVGSLLVLVSVATLTPGLALVAPRFGPPRRAPREAWMDAALTRLTQVAQARAGLVTWMAVLLIVAGVVGMTRLRIESDFTKNFTADSQVVRSYRYVEERLGGAGVFDIMLPAPEQLDWDYLQRVLALETRLREEVVVQDAQGGDVAGLTKVLSLATAINAAIDPERLALDAFRRLAIQATYAQMRSQMGEFCNAFYQPDPAQPDRFYFRIALRTRERRAAAEKQQLLRQVEQIVAEEFPAADDQAAQVTGFYVLLTNLVSSLIRDQWWTFAIAIAGVVTMLLLALRSVRLTLIAMVPNLLPILVVMGALGWCGVNINMGAAMIAAVSLGLSIDGSIHYLTFFRRARQAGQSVAEAIDEVQRGVGPALVFATLALMIGFAILCTSEFLPTVYFGLLVTLSMLGGLLGNVMLLPALLTMLEPAGREQPES